MPQLDSLAYIHQFIWLTVTFTIMLCWINSNLLKSLNLHQIIIQKLTNKKA